MKSKNGINVQTFLMVCAVCCFGISPATASKIVKTGAEPSTIQSADLTQFDEKLQTLSTSVNSRLSDIEVTITRVGERAIEDRSLTRSYALATVLISALFALAAQGLLMRHQRFLDREKAQAEVSNSYVEWQLKQLCELYGPLRAMLGQSNAMYRQMNRVLAAAKSDMFRLRKEEGGDFDNDVFEIFVDGQWTRFRTVKHIGEVYNKGYDVEPYFDDVVNVGARMADLIRDKAGYAQPSDQKLIEVMGLYLAHYAVLERLHLQAKDGQSLVCNKADEQATFPVSIQKLVNDGFATLNREIMDWKDCGRMSSKA